MRKGDTELSKDPRPIQVIVWNGDPNESHFKVGQNGTTAIVAYDESGHMASVPWIAVFKGDEIVCRVQADAVTVSYV